MLPEIVTVNSHLPTVERGSACGISDKFSGDKSRGEVNHGVKRKSHWLDISYAASGDYNEREYETPSRRYANRTSQRREDMTPHTLIFCYPYATFWSGMWPQP